VLNGWDWDYPPDHVRWEFLLSSWNLVYLEFLCSFWNFLVPLRIAAYRIQLESGSKMIPVFSWTRFAEFPNGNNQVPSVPLYCVSLFKFPLVPLYLIPLSSP
jgi:hypothetical protein